MSQAHAQTQPSRLTRWSQPANGGRPTFLSIFACSRLMAFVALRYTATNGAVSRTATTLVRQRSYTSELSTMLERGERPNKMYGCDSGMLRSVNESVSMQTRTISVSVSRTILSLSLPHTQRALT